MMPRCTALLLLLGAAVARPLHAQAPTGADSLTATTLDPLVSTATRDSRRLVTLPAATAVADSVAGRQGRTIGMQETLRMMPGVQAASRFGTEEVQIGIRGSGVRNERGVRGTGVLLDGVLLTEPDAAARLDLIELSAIRQVEVVRGPMSALYAGSSQGAVNLVSRTGRDSRGVTARAQYGSWQTTKLDATLGDEFAGGRGSLFVNGAYTTSDGYRAHSEGRIGRAGMNADYRLAERTMLRLEGNASDLDTKLPGSLTLTEYEANPDAAAPRAAPIGLGRVDQRYRVGTRMEQGFASGGQAMAYFFYGGRTLDFPVATLPAAQLVILDFRRVQGGARVGVPRVGGTPIDVTGGLDYDHIFGADRRYFATSTPRPDSLSDDGEDSAADLGVYAQATWHATPTLAAAAGLRWDALQYAFTSVTPGKVAAQDTTFRQVNPRFSLTWTPAAGRSVYASVSRGWQAPQFNEISRSPGSRIQDVVPTSLWTYEAGTHLLLGSRLLLDAAVFYADVVNALVPVVPVGAPAGAETASAARNVGVELGVSLLATRWLELAAGYTWFDYTFTSYETTVVNASGQSVPVDYSGRKLPGLPSSRVVGEARLHPWPALQGSVQFEWQGRMFVESSNATEGTVYVQAGSTVTAVPFRAVPARALVHLGVQWQPGPVGLFGSVENLFGTQYVATVIVNDGTGRFYESGPGTVVTLGMRVSAWPGGGPGAP
jgi:iron complex outermembrane receptor protein